MKTTEYKTTRKFPSPIGELHFSMGWVDSIQRYMLLFPSPIGELHFSILMCPSTSELSLVSVPYRGATFLNLVDKSVRFEWCCFRPLSGSYISQLKPRFTYRTRFSVSVPYRGATFLNRI